MTKHYLWAIVSIFWLCLFTPLTVFAEEATGAEHAVRTEDSVQLRSENFTLSGNIDGAQGVDMISELERFRAALLEIHGLPSSSQDNRLEIYVVSDPEIFDILGVEENFVAIYSQTNAGPRALINGSAGAFDASSGSVLRHGLRHEYAHHFTRTYLGLTEPVWLAEGLAEYYAGYVENADGSYHFGAPNEVHEYVLSYPVSGWVDMRDVLSSIGKISRARFPIHNRPRDWIERPDNVSFFYAQSWALTHWALNQSGETNLKAGSEKLSALVERLIVNDMPMSRDLSSWPTQEALRLESETKDEAIAQSVLLEFGVPLQLGEKTTKETDTLESRITDYLKAGVPVLSGQPKPDRAVTSVSVKTLSPTQAAAIQYRQLSLTAGSRALIDPRMKSLKAQIEADPETAPSLIISEAAQKFATGSTQSAVNLMRKAAEQGQLTPEDEILALNIAFGDFTNHSYQNPGALRAKIRPALARRPNDVTLLLMMAMTALGDLRAADISGDGQRSTAISPEARAALQTLEDMDAPTTRPLQTLPLVNLYADQEKHKAALALLYRALAFEPHNQFSLHSVARQLEEWIKEDAAP